MKCETVNDEILLWRQLQGGIKEALDSIYRSHVDALYNYGVKINRDGDLVKDCIQDLFVDLWQQKEQISIPENPRFYLLKALRYKLLRQQLRQTKYDKYVVEKCETSVQSYESELLHLECSDEQKIALKCAIEKLNLRQKEALILRFYEGMNCDEIAQIMELKVQSVYNLLHQSIRLLRQDLQTSFVHFDLLLLTICLSYLVYTC